MTNQTPQVTQGEFLASEWQVGDTLYGCWHFFTITGIEKKSWGKLPMSCVWTEGHSKPDPKCIGTATVTTLGPSGFGLTSDPNRGPEQWNCYRAFRDGVEIWRDQARFDKWPSEYRIHDDPVNALPACIEAMREALTVLQAFRLDAESSVLVSLTAALAKAEGKAEGGE